MKTKIDENGNVTITSEIREAFVNSELVLMGIALGKIGGTWVGSRVERSERWPHGEDLSSRGRGEHRRRLPLCGVRMGGR